jgi:uncharacterized protein (DUF302 family)
MVTSSHPATGIQRVETCPVIVKRSTVGQRFTIDRLVAAVERRGLTVFTRIDHAEQARRVNIDLLPLEVVVFGDPSVGTPLLISDPRVGIDLPTRMLVWEDGAPQSLVGYHDPRELATRYELDPHREVLDHMAGLLAGIAAEAAGDVRG